MSGANEVQKKVPLILDAWLDYIRLEDQVAEAVPAEGKWFDREGIVLTGDKLTMAPETFDKWRNLRESRRRNGEDFVLGCSFPSIHLKDGRRSFSLPLFTVEVSGLLAGGYDPGGWTLSGCEFQPSPANLLRLSLFVEDEVPRLVTNEGLHAFLRASFACTGVDLESLARELACLELPGDYRVDSRPYLFVPPKGNVTRNLKADLRDIQQAGASAWSREKPGYQYLFGRPAPGGDEVMYLGAFPSGYPPTASQAAALKHARHHPVTAVQGPPGSGKTSLILNLIAQQVVERALLIAESQPDRNTLALITSTNNRAVTNVVEKLAGADASTPLVLEGGNRSIIEGRMAEQLNDCMDLVERTAPDPFLHASLAKRIRETAAMLREQEREHLLLREQREEDEKAVAKLAADLEQWNAERVRIDGEIPGMEAAIQPLAAYAGFPEAVYRRALSHFDIRYLDLPSADDSLLDRIVRWIRGPSGRKVLRTLLRDIEPSLRTADGAGFALRVPTDLTSFHDERRRLGAALAAAAEYRALTESLADARGERDRLRERIARAEADKAAAEERLGGELLDFYGTFFRDQHAVHADLFRTAHAFLFQEALLRKPEVLGALGTYQKAVVAGEQDPKRRLAQDPVKHLTALSLVFPVLTCTLHSVRNVLPSTAAGLVDRAIVDEAGMISAHHLLPVLVRANRAIVVGDPLQIEPVVPHTDTTIDAYRERAFLRKGLKEEDYLRYAPCAIGTATAYHRAAGATGEPDDLGGGIALREHYRCAEPIALLCDRIGRYGFEVCTPERESRLGAHLIAYHVEGEVRGLVNVEEVEAVKALVAHLRRHGYTTAGAEGDIGIISPFRPQADALDAALQAEWPGRSRQDSIGTVHTFQGGERPAIILSTRICRERDSANFINRRPNLLNVAVSRARDVFILVGNLFRLRRAGGYAAQVLRYIEEHGVVVDYHAMRGPEPVASSGRDVLFNCDHLDAMRDAIRQAREELVLVCPWIRGDAAQWFVSEVRTALDRGVRVVVLYGYKQGYDQDEAMVRAIRELFSGYPRAHLGLVRSQGTHEKLLFCDDAFAVVGSWNWLSHPYIRPCASRLLDRPVQVRRETSVRVTDRRAVAQMRSSVAELLSTSGAAPSRS